MYANYEHQGNKKWRVPREKHVCMYIQYLKIIFKFLCAAEQNPFRTPLDWKRSFITRQLDSTWEYLFFESDCNWAGKFGWSKQRLFALDWWRCNITRMHTFSIPCVLICHHREKRHHDTLYFDLFRRISTRVDGRHMREVSLEVFLHVSRHELAASSSPHEYQQSASSSSSSRCLLWKCFGIPRI